MASILPFRAVRFQEEKVGRLEDVITPPYDVIDDQAQAVFSRRSPYNMIHLDLGKSLDRKGIDDRRYVRAKELFERWQQEGILLRDQTPGLYLYYVTYVLPRGKRLTRKGFMAITRLAELDEGIIKPHERTFSEVTSDRLKLMTTCEAQFSQIFTLYSDQEGQVMEWLEAAKPSEPLCSVTNEEGSLHTLWQITDAQTIRQVHDFFQGKSLYIADGHHRYTTALQLRRIMAERHGGVPDDNPYNHTVLYLSSMEDPGLSVLPTHRLVTFPGGLTMDELVQKVAPYFGVQEIVGDGREALLVEVLGQMDEYGRQAFMLGVYQADQDRCLLLTLKPGVMEEVFGDTIAPVLRDLDVVVLSELLLAHILKLDHDRCEKEDLIRYYSDPDEALDVAVKESSTTSPYSQLLFLMNPTSVTQVQRVADAGMIMPHKSTFFYPKVLSGLLMNKMVFEEKVGL